MSKKQKRNIFTIGKENFEFDYSKEKKIYSFLWGLKISKKEEKELLDNEKMNTHAEWSSYINNKYKDCSDEKLKEFSKFLSQRIKTLKPHIEISNITVPIMITLIIDSIFELLTDLAITDSTENIVLSASTFWGMFIVLFIALLVLLFVFVMLISNVISPFWDNNTEELLITDYKEVIDNLIKDKVENKKSEKRKKK
ncbi:MAG: hypothetical protein IKW30_04500 [Lachnospiraceae bacterium]|nr:hypothetical protein [Lachnospiraceae bacterium]